MSSDLSKNRGSESCLDPQTRKCGDSQPSEARTPKGRFASSYSGNPKGRPPKVREDPGAILRRLLDEAAPQSSGGSANQTTIGELLLRKTIMDAMADPRLALSVLKLAAASSAQGAQIAAKHDQEEAERHQAILDGYFTRTLRQRRLEAQPSSADGESRENEVEQ